MAAVPPPGRITHTLWCAHAEAPRTDDYVPIYQGHEAVWRLVACSEACFVLLDPHNRATGALQIGRLTALPDGRVRLAAEPAARRYLAG